MSIQESIQKIHTFILENDNDQIQKFLNKNFNDDLGLVNPRIFERHPMAKELEQGLINVESLVEKKEIELLYAEPSKVFQSIIQESTSNFDIPEDIQVNQIITYALDNLHDAFPELWQDQGQTNKMIHFQKLTDLIDQNLNSYKSNSNHKNWNSQVFDQRHDSTLQDDMILKLLKTPSRYDCIPEIVDPVDLIKFKDQCPGYWNYLEEQKYKIVLDPNKRSNESLNLKSILMTQISDYLYHKDQVLVFPENGFQSEKSVLDFKTIQTIYMLEIEPNIPKDKKTFIQKSLSQLFKTSLTQLIKSLAYSWKGILQILQYKKSFSNFYMSIKLNKDLNFFLYVLFLHNPRFMYFMFSYFWTLNSKDYEIFLNTSKNVPKEFKSPNDLILYLKHSYMNTKQSKVFKNISIYNTKKYLEFVYYLLLNKTNPSPKVNQEKMNIQKDLPKKLIDFGQRLLDSKECPWINPEKYHERLAFLNIKINEILILEQKV